MYARVVRFKDVDVDRINSRKAELEGGQPPEGVPAKGIRIIVDEDQNTAVVVIMFETEEDMQKGGEAAAAMDASDTPGTRISVDQGEVKVKADM